MTELLKSLSKSIRERQLIWWGTLIGFCRYILFRLTPDDANPVRQYSELHHVLRLAGKRLDDPHEHTVLVGRDRDNQRGMAR